MKTTYIIVPGYANSGPTHWQTLWESQLDNCIRVQQKDWIHPLLDDWVEELDRMVRLIDTPIVFIAHSLGCITVIHWAYRKPHRNVVGALLVGACDLSSKAFKDLNIHSFDFHKPLTKLPFPSILVASSDDPFISMKKAREMASTLGSRFVEIGPKGHIGEASNVGDWPEGKALLKQIASD